MATQDLNLDDCAGALRLQEAPTVVEGNLKGNPNEYVRTFHPLRRPKCVKCCLLVACLHKRLHFRVTAVLFHKWGGLASEEDYAKAASIYDSERPKRATGVSMADWLVVSETMRRWTQGESANESIACGAESRDASGRSAKP